MDKRKTRRNKERIKKEKKNERKEQRIVRGKENEKNSIGSNEEGVKEEVHQI